MLPTNPLLNATAPAGPHLPLATLRQYAAGTLAPAAQHRVEAHALACPRCADMLEGLLQTPPATTDQALAQLQQRLRRRVQLAPQALPATRAHRRHRLMALQLAAAATLLFGLVAGGWWTWQQRHMPADTAARPVATPRAAATAEPPTTIAATLPATTATVAVARPARSARHRVAVSKTKRSLIAASRAPSASAAATSYPSADASALVPAPASVAPATTASNALAEVVVVPTPMAAAAPASKQAAYDTSVAAAPGLMGRTRGLALRATPPASAPTMVRADAMPAAPAIPPTPVGGYSAWREKLRHEAAEFKPELPEQPLSGTVQLRLLIGADGKVQEIRVLHGLRADYDEEAQRLVCDGAGWVPGIGGGKRAAQAVDVAVPFQ
ncbi:hypothetical protein HHL22_11170 [Hymenobacter sp. RP-2-7]|uniref:Zinc-finger domain-containing protein n=1 Tax=Hymenobacter polaris TaxID=2682546 RepID=A0A7Y0AEC7_9BACT|nr:energy transducer TonB [Hymenobacter polaris]NML65767.1 hypothetical protein [Hymenobacter polaris]